MEIIRTAKVIEDNRQPVPTSGLLWGNVDRPHPLTADEAAEGFIQGYPDEAEEYVGMVVAEAALLTDLENLCRQFFVRKHSLSVTKLGHNVNELAGQIADVLEQLDLLREGEI